MSPFPFTGRDLEPGRLQAGTRHTLGHFVRWRDANPGPVAEHVDRYTAHLAAARRRRAGRGALVLEAVHFGVYNMAEVFEPATAELVVAGVQGRLAGIREVVSGLDARRGVAGIVDGLQDRLPVLRGVPETRWLAERLDRLHRILPESVVRAGSLGKVIRTLSGVLAIGAYDTLDLDPIAARAHLGRVVPGAYAYGAAYAIVDDTFHDAPAGTIPPADRDRYGRLLAQALATGAPVDAAGLPDHPVVDEILDVYALLLRDYPFDAYRHLYHAAESMHLASHRDSTRPPDRPLTAAYPDLFVKAGMSRVVANILARRSLPDRFYTRCVNTIFLSQLRDDLVDVDEDRHAGRLTPFTCPPAALDTDPLYDLFAYNAYVAAVVYGGDTAVAEALSWYGAARLARHLTTGRVTALLRDHAATPEIARFLRTAAGLPARTLRRLELGDQRLKREVGQVLDRRAPTAVDCRTFVADRLPYIDDVLARHTAAARAGELGEVVTYALGGTGKRLRPALTLMLAEGLGVAPAAIEPVLAAGELFHTASLLFDDLPAQDDATIRRGRPAAHLVFPESSVQLAALSMISTGFGLLARLDRHHPPHRVTEVIAYVGTILGPERMCRGQYLDLRLVGATATDAEVLRMYELKTSTAIEAALVPLMMVLDRPAGEIDLIRRYAYHAGIAFQIQDDILDATATSEVLGKDVAADDGKANAVRLAGVAEARRMMLEHVADAVRCCERLPFDTGLLVEMVRHFATRSR